MRETAPVVRSQNSALRDLMPFYSTGHFAFAAVLVVGIYLMMLRLDPPTAVVVALGSFVGIEAVGNVGKPSWMLVAPNQVDELNNCSGSIATVSGPPANGCLRCRDGCAGATTRSIY